MNIAQYGCHPITPNRRTRHTHARWLNDLLGKDVRTAAYEEWTRHLNHHRFRHASWMMQHPPHINAKHSQQRLHEN